MRRVLLYTIFAFLVLGLQVNARAQGIVVPAGTLLHCTLDEPNFSSATADIGDPVVCHLNSLQQFGRVVFPRGSYLGGHLESSKEPGHFFGKGNLKLEFDRIGLPNADIPVPSKVVAARGYHVDRQGEIVGRGHAKRDVVEWMIPPLWPWKFLMLPARGPRPTLKGEQQVTLRLMDDIVVPSSTAAGLAPGWHYFGEPASQRYSTPRSSIAPEHATGVVSELSDNTQLRGMANPAATTAPAIPPVVESNASVQSQPTHTWIALKSDSVYAVTRYRIDNGQLICVLTNGTTNSVDLHEVDWRRTSQLNSERGASNAPSGSLRAYSGN